MKCLICLWSHSLEWLFAYMVQLGLLGGILSFANITICIFSHAYRYYAICFLNQLVLHPEEDNLATQLIVVYLSFFKVSGRFPILFLFHQNSPLFNPFANYCDEYYSFLTSLSAVLKFILTQSVEIFTFLMSFLPTQDLQASSDLYTAGTLFFRYCQHRWRLLKIRENGIVYRRECVLPRFRFIVLPCSLQMWIASLIHLEGLTESCARMEHFFQLMWWLPTIPALKIWDIRSHSLGFSMSAIYVGYSERTTFPQYKDLMKPADPE